MRKSVSDLPDQPQIVADRPAYQSEAVDSACSTSVCTQWLIVSQQFPNFLRIIDEEVDENMLQQRIKKRRTHDHKATVILFLMLKQLRKLKERVFQRKMPFQFLSR